MKSGSILRGQDALDAAFVTQKPRALETSAPSLRRISNGSHTVEIGIQPGDILKIKGVDVWVNPENTDMEMARFHDPTVSGTIRYLGASWRRGYGDSDDKVFRSLLEEVSRKWGVERPVPDGAVFLSDSGRLKKTNGVRKIAHVACLEPADPSVPGRGYELVDDVKACVTGVLKAIDAANRGRARLTSVLFPLFGAGANDSDARLTARIMVNAAADYARSGRASLKRILFLAYTAKDESNFREALDQADGLSAG